MPVVYNTNSLRPAPLLSITKDSRRTSTGVVRGQEYTIVLKGTIVNVDGSGANNLDSPGASGSSDTRMRGVQGAQSYLRNVFSTDSLLEIYSPESVTNKFSAYCKPQSITFEEGVWVNRCNYSVVLKSDYIDGYDKFDELDSIEESWDITRNEDNSDVVAHRIQATGRSLKNSIGVSNDPLAAAMQWVKSRMYNVNSSLVLVENTVGSGVMQNYLTQSVVAWDDSEYYSNKGIVESVNPVNYTYVVSETFLHTQLNYKEEYSSSVNMEQDWPHRATVSINGTITGLGTTIDDNTGRLNNARNYYNLTVDPNLYLRAAAYAPSGYTVNPTFVTKQISYDVKPGNVKYNASFVAMNGTPLISGCSDESISINDTGKTNIVAQFQIPGRSAGPFFQDIRTYTAPSRTVTVNATIVSSGNTTSANLLSRYLAKPNTSDLINVLKPSANYYYCTGDTEDFNPIKGSYSRTVSWLMSSSSGVPYSAGTPSGIVTNVQ